ncbi:hypothetical protein NX862_14780 [Rhodobacter sp. KR11]|uniref:beta strand repeat-containing protein n=1 Tax=Rhodobacter sp. KR11 TaxID=2974588 RepID=UPI002223D1C2|nr:hypothetical protein [Rhodobacter sp. KR11]MCW1920023.1 hypothetical protein [Rhodobacter sp. KR11]
MSSFVISTNTTAGQVLGASEFGIVAGSGSVLSTVGSAVTMSGNATLISYGAIAATTASPLTLNAVGATSVTVTATGSIIAAGIDLAAVSGTFSGNFALSNAGQISGGQGISLAAVAAGSQINFGNTGSLLGLGNTAGAALSLTLNTTTRAVITNSGMLSTAGTGATIFATGNGAVTLTNTGHLLNASVLEAAIQVDGSLTLRNSGLIEGNVTASLSGNIFNSGTINGHIRLNSNNDVVRISGLVMGDVTLGNGTNVFYQTGGRVMGSVFGGAGNDSYFVDRADIVIVDTAGGYDWVQASTNFRLSAGIEKLSLIGATGMFGIGTTTDNWIIGDAGDDVLRGLGGNDSLEGGMGNNRIFGGVGRDTIRAGEGDDLLNGGGGDDQIFVGTGNDTLAGGLGSDTLRFDAIADPAGVVANMATNTYSFLDAGVLSVSGFENLFGSAQNDILTGDGFANGLSGATGADQLYGGAGNDSLNGGIKADTMDGGAGADQFIYAAYTDSQAAQGIDRITAFETVDLINLALIDPVAGGLDNAFTYRGNAAFTGAAAEVRWYQTGGTTVIEVRGPGATANDMEIVLGNLVTLTAANFVL